MVRATRSLLGEKSGDMHPRDYPIFSPRPNEWPPAGMGCERSEQVKIENIRIAKNGEAVVGAYEVERVDLTVFQIKWLIVHPQYRNRGLGRWLLAHAIGIIESKGGREVIVKPQTSSFFENFGFEGVSEHEMRLVLTPE